MHLLLIGIAIGTVLGWTLNVYWSTIVSLMSYKAPSQDEE